MTILKMISNSFNDAIETGKRQHSSLAESYRDKYSLWIRVKDRNIGDIVYGSKLNEICEWIENLGVRTEFKMGRNRREFSYHNRGMMYADQYYIGVFPRTEWQMNAIKIVWGEYFTDRNLPRKD